MIRSYFTGNALILYSTPSQSFYSKYCFPSLHLYAILIYGEVKRSIVCMRRISSVKTSQKLLNDELIRGVII